MLKDGDDDNDLVFYIPFNIIQIILRWWKSDNERLPAMKERTESEPGTSWSEIESPNHTVTWTLR